MDNIEEGNIVDTVFNSLKERFTEKKRIIWTEFKRCLLVGIVYDMALYAGHTTFSKPTSILSWTHLSNIYNQALRRHGIIDLAPTVDQLRNQYKYVKTASKAGRIKSLEELDTNYRKINKGQLVSEDDIEGLLLKPGEKIEELKEIIPYRVNEWTLKEEAILYGAILEIIRKRGSFHSSKGDTDPWFSVKRIYDTNKDYLKSENEKVLVRSAKALARRYKDMKASLHQPGKKLYFKKLFYHYLALMEKKIQDDPNLQVK